MSGAWKASRVKSIQLCFLYSFCWPVWDLLVGNYINKETFLFSLLGALLESLWDPLYVVNLVLDERVTMLHAFFPSDLPDCSLRYVEKERKKVFMEWEAGRWYIEGGGREERRDGWKEREARKEGKHEKKKGRIKGKRKWKRRFSFPSLSISVYSIHIHGIVPWEHGGRKRDLLGTKQENSEELMASETVWDSSCKEK